jgi:PAS domain S-box-containing protein
MIGRDLADLIIPPEYRGSHGEARVLDHPLELTGQRADGGRFPVELAITRPELDGPPLFTGYLCDVTERHRADAELRALVAEPAALRRVATLVASDGDQQ